MFDQLELPLFDPPTYDELIAEKGIAGLRVSINRRLRRGWHVTVQPYTRERHLVVPGYLEDAPTAIKEALLSWAMLPDARRSTRKREIRRRKSEIEARVWRYVEQAHPKRSNGRRVDPARYEGSTRGTVYDLREVFDSINARYFASALESYVRWGETASVTSYQTTREAPDGTRYNLITIAGAYDHPTVPRYAIEGIMYHEMLHIAIPPVVTGGRRSVHGREFRRAERRFEQFGEWCDWQRAHLRRLAAAMRRRRRP
ncbi:MAG: hypothetical protein GF331_02035 [Chitinivibrionales bacterium]|nr:hypothetical protein [Chitinivibrionales bacterium]